MNNLEVLPSQKGKLSNEPDWDRLFGVEIEYDPRGFTMGRYRLALYKNEIDTLDDACPNLHTVRSRRGPPDRYYADTLCGTVTDRNICGGRISHVNSILQGDLLYNLDLIPRGAEAVFQDAHTDWRNRSLMSILADYNDHPIIFQRVLSKIFPRINTPQRYHWNLGTDPSAGFELRTVPLQGKAGWAAIEDACSAIRLIGGEATDACGGHIHQDMTNEDAKSTARVLLTYRMLEPLLAAVVDPTRYYPESYNAPSWRGPQPGGSNMKTLFTEKAASTGWSTRWLNTAQLDQHGTFEFRGLEGTLNASTFKNYSLLLNRFIQASKNSSWGVSLRQVVPIRVDNTSILALFKFLDITRKDVAPELKELKDWYLDRYREFRERDAFQESLVVYGNSAFASLSQLRKTGKHKNTTAFVAPVKMPPKKTHKELGIFFYQVFERFTAAVVPLRNNRARHSLVDNLDNHFQEAILKLKLHIRESEDRQTDLFDWMCIENVGDGECPILNEFWNYLRTFDFESLGRWYEKYMLEEDRPNKPRMDGLGILLEEWAACWGDSWPSYNSLTEAFSGGDISCVDF